MVIFIFGVPFSVQSQLVFIRHPGNLLGLKAERDEYASERDRTSHGRTISFAGTCCIFVCLPVVFSAEHQNLPSLFPSKICSSKHYLMDLKFLIASTFTHGSNFSHILLIWYGNYIGVSGSGLRKKGKFVPVHSMSGPGWRSRYSDPAGRSGFESR